jgi:two-component system nitrate/nitrite sensor histidine kinase NarX
LKGLTFGVLAVARKKAKPFNQRQHAMLTTIAGQVALVIANVHRLADLEYKTIMNERIRLSREIHDGVAQSLGFLKLKMAQIIGYLERSEIERIHETIPICYETITESYQEVRQVIDGLRIDIEGSGLLEWMRRAVIEFEENMDFRVTLDEPVADIELAPEIHAQLIRILQEALNNARRHSDAEEAWVACRTYKNDLILDIRDSGKGFDISSIPNPSRHGLQGMRERAELIGADFQVISKPEEGTTVRVRLPLGLEEKAV